MGTLPVFVLLSLRSQCERSLTFSAWHFSRLSFFPSSEIDGIKAIFTSPSVSFLTVTFQILFYEFSKVDFCYKFMEFKYILLAVRRVALVIGAWIICLSSQSLLTGAYTFCKTSIPEAPYTISELAWIQLWRLQPFVVHGRELLVTFRPSLMFSVYTKETTCDARH